MKIACEACGAKYTIADVKVRGRKVKIRCKSCGTPIVVDGQLGEAPSLSDAETDATLEPAEAPVTWSVNLSDTDSRTMSTEEILAAYAAGVVTADAFVWKDGMGDWVPLLDSELAPLLPAAPAPAFPPVGNGQLFAAPNQPARPAATRAAQPDNTQDLFGSLDTAGAEYNGLATSAPTIPQAGASAYDDGKLTGARNENSVLFSLDALKAGFSPSVSPNASKPAPKVPSKGPGAARPQQPSNPDDPFGMNSGNGLMGIGGSSGVLFGADNHALLTAPAPPPPAPTPAQVASGGVPTANATNNKLVFIVGGVGGVIIIGLLLALLMGKKGDASVASESSTMPSASGALADTRTKPDEAKPETKPAEDAKPTSEAKPAETPSASASASPSAATETKPAAVAHTVSTVKKPVEAAPPAADAPPFSKAAAISALSAAASGAGGCKKPGGPTGPGKATVTFAPSGRVTTATVAGGSYAGTPVGGCVASIFRRAHVPAFSGSSITVSKSFQIN